MLAPACGGDLPRSVVEHFGTKWTSTLPIVVVLQVRSFLERVTSLCWPAKAT